MSVPPWMWFSTWKPTARPLARAQCDLGAGAVFHAPKVLCYERVGEHPCQQVEINAREAPQQEVRAFALSHLAWNRRSIRAIRGRGP